MLSKKKIEKNHPLRSYKSKEKVDGFCSMLMGFVHLPTGGRRIDRDLEIWEISGTSFLRSLKCLAGIIDKHIRGILTS